MLCLIRRLHRDYGPQAVFRVSGRSFMDEFWPDSCQKTHPFFILEHLLYSFQPLPHYTLLNSRQTVDLEIRAHLDLYPNFQHTCFVTFIKDS